MLSESVARKLRSATQRRIDHQSGPPHVRLARVLVEMADDHGATPYGKAVVIGIDVTRLEWGSLIGAFLLFTATGLTLGVAAWPR